MPPGRIATAEKTACMVGEAGPRASYFTNCYAVSPGMAEQMRGRLGNLLFSGRIHPMTRHRGVLSLLLVASTAIATEAGAAEINQVVFSDATYADAD